MHFTQRVGRARRYARAGSESTHTRRTHAPDCSHREEKTLDAKRGCATVWNHQPRMNDLLRGRVSRFSLDALVNIANAIGRRLRMQLESADLVASLRTLQCTRRWDATSRVTRADQLIFAMFLYTMLPERRERIKSAACADCLRICLSTYCGGKRR